jgi:type IV pilus assembly protein PilB
LTVSQKQHDSIVDILVRRQAVDRGSVNSALAEAEAVGLKMERYLVDNNLVSEVDMALALSEYLGIPPMQLSGFTPTEHLLELMPQEVMTRHLLVPVAKVGKLLTVAMADPFDVVALDQVQALTGLEVMPVIAPEKQVQDLLERHVKDKRAGLEDILRDVAEGEEIEVGKEEVDELSLDEMLNSAEDAPVIRIVNSIMVESLRRGASDIHIEPMEKLIRLRYRVDGVLYESHSPPKVLQSAIVSRVKIMSNLDIAERRVPQDGRFKVRALGKDVDIRVSILPTVHGEKIVMRILDKAMLAPSVSSLGLEQNVYESFMTCLRQPHGMILVTGPTGSGKTTTLYSALQELNQTGVNIITSEDPVEYQLHGINQVQVNADVGLTFAAALRSILRQDPDIVMVGEIRDGETAGIAVKAALTGHLVLSTLHTNDAAGAINRLGNMGVEPFLLASSILMTQAQRLFRRLCPACKQERNLPPDVMRLNAIDPTPFQGSTTYEATGCPKCTGIGYRGRGALMEILMVNDAIRQLILKETSAAELAQTAIRDGMLTLRDVGLLRVQDGTTSLEEVLRVTSRD